MQQQTAQGGESLRHVMAADLFTAQPQLGADIDARPQDPQQTTLDFVESLSASETPEEALAVCAYALQPRHAVWWAHECLMKIKEFLSEADLGFLELAAAWVAEPGEETRSAAVEAAYPHEMVPSPGQWIALGAGWTEGSMNPSGMPEVPPPPHLSPTAVHVGVLTALAQVEIADREATLTSFVKMARQLATGH